MIDDERFRAFFEGQPSVALLRSQLAALDAYERILTTGSLDCGSLNTIMNDLIKATLDVQLTVLKSTGPLGENALELQQEWLESYRRFLQAAIAERESGSAG